jgi:hypothetical protein
VVGLVSGVGGREERTRAEGSELRDDGLETWGTKPGLIGPGSRPSASLGPCATGRVHHFFSTRGWGV